MAKDQYGNSDEISKFGILYEAVQDDIKKMLELMNAQQPAVQMIPKISESIEKLEYDMTTIKLVTTATNSDMKLIKIRTEKLDALQKQLNENQQRLVKLEQAI